MEKIVSVSVLNDWIYSQPDQVFIDLTGSTKVQAIRGTDDEFDISYFLTETAPKFEAWLKEQGLFPETMGKAGTYLHYNPNNLDNIATACAAIVADYDDDLDALWKLGCFPPYRNADGTPAEGTPWKKWDLGGDDDVDYNGSYITIVLDVLVAYEKKVQA